MKLHTAEINALKSKIEELTECNNLKERVRLLEKEDEAEVERLLPEAVKLIKHKFNGRFAKLTYKESGSEVLIVRNMKNTHFVVLVEGRQVMSFVDIESLARFLLVSEDLILETIVKRGELDGYFK